MIRNVVMLVLTGVLACTFSPEVDPTEATANGLESL